MEKVFKELHGKKVVMLIDAVFPDKDGIASWELQGVLYYKDGVVNLITPSITYYINPNYIIAIWEKEY